MTKRPCESARTHSAREGSVPNRDLRGDLGSNKTPGSLRVFWGAILGSCFGLVAAGAFGASLVATAACSSSSSGSNDADGGNSDRSKATVEVGAQAVQDRKCQSCHTQNMAGQMTPLAYPQDTRVELYPPNLTPDMATGLGTWTDDQIAYAIRFGQDKDGLELCPQMKHFSTMNDYEVYSIVKYLRSIPAVNQKIPRSVCPPLKTKDEQDAG